MATSNTTRTRTVSRDEFDSFQRHVDQQFDGVNQSLKDISREISGSRKTDWQAFAAWSSVIILICGGVGTLAIAPMREGLLSLRDSLQYHERLGGHPTMDAKVQVIGEQLHELRSEHRELQQEVWRSE